MMMVERLYERAVVRSLEWCSFGSFFSSFFSAFSFFLCVALFAPVKRERRDIFIYFLTSDGRASVYFCCGCLIFLLLVVRGSSWFSPVSVCCPRAGLQLLLAEERVTQVLILITLQYPAPTKRARTDYLNGD